MKSSNARPLALTLLCAGLLATGSALAHGDRGGDWPGYGRPHHGHAHHARGHGHHYGHDHGYGRFRAPPPVAYYGAPYAYRAPAPVYRSHSAPAVVIGVDIPPLVFPLR
jgi:hypothetical protein